MQNAANRGERRDWPHGRPTQRTVGLELRDININDIEKRLKLEAPIKNAEVSTQLNGKINIQIEQRVPLIRIFTADVFNFYLDNEGIRIPASGLDPARVLVATDIQGDTMIKKVYTVSTYVHENAFMKALSEQIFVNSQSDLIIIPKIHKQRIIIGDTSDLDDKFARLEAFYRDGMKNFGWEKYKTINLKFKDQVVCN